MIIWRRKLEITDESTINKLILLYVFEAMDVPITGDTIIEMCTSRKDKN